MPKLGAARFYKMVEKNEVGFVQMYLISLTSNADAVQAINFKATYDAWKNGGCQAEMLTALVSYDPLNKWSSYRNYFESNSRFKFGGRVLEYIERLLEPDDPSIESLTKARQLISAAAGRIDSFGDIGNRLATALVLPVLPRTWPYPIMSTSRKLATEVMTALDQRIKVTEEFVDWYLGMFGTFDDENKPPSIMNTLKLRPDLFIKLVPNVAVQKNMLATYPYDNIIDKAVDGHRSYLKLKPLLPWIGE